MNHKHKGVLTSKGDLRSHPVERKHGDSNVLKWHNLALASAGRWNKKETAVKKKPFNKRDVKVTTNRAVMCPVDKDGYIMIDLTQVSQNGIRLKFQRREGKTKRTVGLQIEK